MKMTTALVLATLALLIAALPHLGEGADKPYPPDKLGEMVKLGKEIVHNTAQHPLSKPYVGNVLNCSTCHLKDGTDVTAAPFTGIAAFFPRYHAREGKVLSLQNRIADCFMRSMNGTLPPVDSPVTMAITAYITWLSDGVPLNMGGPKTSIPYYRDSIEVNPKEANIEKGKQIYAQQCAACHGDNGQGNPDMQLPGASEGGMPPLWGPESYNKGAGLYVNLSNAANFIKAGMPYGSPGLSADDARDVAAFMNAQDRPDFILKDHLPKECKDACIIPMKGYERYFQHD